MTGTATALLLAIAGFGGLSLTMARHSRQAAFDGSIIARRVPMRPLSWLLIIASAIIDMAKGNWRFGLVEWIGLAGVAAAIVMLAHTYRPRLVFPLAGAAFVLSLLLMPFSS